MIKLNRTTEYGLVALQHMSRKQALDADSVTSAREVADCYGLPFEITAKTLQRLRDSDIIRSAQGSRGGYNLQKPLSQISLAQFLDLMEGNRSVVTCTTTGTAKGSKVKETICEYRHKCQIRELMTDLNERVVDFLSGISLGDLAGFSTKTKRVED